MGFGALWISAPLFGLLFLVWAIATDLDRVADALEKSNQKSGDMEIMHENR